MTAYYNEHDRFAAAWLRELIKAGLIAPGEVDERSIEQVEASELRGFTQCHFFAGIGVWSYALRAAGWPDDSPVWTGSCPCQGFSASGKRGGFSDQRHLWPAWFRLIGECRPDTIFGEQVASKDGLAWLDVVSADLEGARYAIGAADTCAAGYGAPHIRQRLYFVADAQKVRPSARISWEQGTNQREGQSDSGIGRGFRDGALRCSQAGELANAEHAERRAEHREHGNSHRRPGLRGGGAAGGEQGRPDVAQPGVVNGYWRNAEWLWCRDGKHRAVEPGTFPLAHGAAARVGRLRGYGNALNAEQAIAFIEAFRETQ